MAGKQRSVLARHGRPNPMSNNPPVTALVTRAASGDQLAWDALVERYAPLIWSICRRYQLGDADADDVGQTVWLQLLDHLGELREPAVLAGWLATTTRRECSRARRAARGPQAAGHVLDAESIPDAQTPTAEQELLAAERTLRCVRHSPVFLAVASSCSPCSLTTGPCRMPRSASSWASRPGASGHAETAAWAYCAAIR
jgi:Sigma-70 region 2